MQSRHIARELALFSINQLPSQPQKLETKTLDDIVTAVVRSLHDETKELLQTASVELQRSQERISSSEIRTGDIRQDLQAVEGMVREAIELTKNAINNIGSALEFPVTLVLSQRDEVRNYAIDILKTVNTKRSHIDETISSALVNWQLDRLAQVDKDILRIATAEMMFMGVASKIAIDEAVELAKRYSSEDGYRFINGVLRRIDDQLKALRKTQ
ncbi:MAG: transcription antitermination factor NusB [Pseudanabaena sp.]|jgi:N utilization substance protein B|uniref:transcription antitermination factor NusB n=1 Tax=Pseudanabaena mucicola TaxID=71190 RepID=UPI002575F00A|nr:transcription antitermination factor NusB [Pseudanabaena mucicola]MCA6573513.1 transcription antitermination protein NusB [Pseudanabaena sp. M53BS1SP1A06MG]MCA6582640.1 transcription antitermination protein NusB [Pseudanabaena sp. M34BS1SP1A06MG]MCA6584936.1 transcription antitermination protein NusB [Pseudanabaena sp. M051S1SP1A06QC]MCA6588770.1 transcription antitermination protein NusB [Pseudanabaena sp. M109S1SP1A06QC]MCA6594648.1 transcription antitermination protein NusB [Pseudanabaen